MSTTDLASLSEIMRGAPVALLLTVAVIGSVREWWVPGVVHRRLLAESVEREREWRELALASTGIAERAVDAVGKRVPTGRSS